MNRNASNLLLTLIALTALLAGCLQPGVATPTPAATPRPTLQLGSARVVGSGNLKLPGSLLDNLTVKTDLAIPFQVDLNVSIGASASASPSWTPDATTCSQFQSIPDCSYVPSQYQDLCRQCKAKSGY